MRPWRRTPTATQQGYEPLVHDANISSLTTPLCLLLYSSGAKRKKDL